MAKGWVCNRSGYGWISLILYHIPYFFLLGVGYVFLHLVFALRDFCRLVGRILSAYFAPLHRTLESRGAIRANMKRLITEISKEKHSVSHIYSDVATHVHIYYLISKWTHNRFFSYHLIYEYIRTDIGHPVSYSTFFPWSWGQTQIVPDNRLRQLLHVAAAAPSIR